MKNSKLLKSIPFILIFLYLFLFFSYLHPIVIADCDDILTTLIGRMAIPDTEAWNPARLFAEIFYPLASRFGGYVIYPIFTSDIFDGFTYSYAIIVSLMVTVLMYSMFKLLRKYGDSYWLSVAGALFFFLCHFWVFRSAKEGNTYMLNAVDSCTYFYYVLPNILNGIIVLNIVRDPNSVNVFEGSYLRRSLSLVLIYFAVFSNIWSSIIIAVFAGCILLKKYIDNFKNDKNVFKLFVKEKNYSLILILWIIQQFTELSGGRASSVSEYQQASIVDMLLPTIKNVLSTINSFNKYFMLLCFIIFVLYILLSFIKNYAAITDNLIFSIINLILIGIYTVLSCAFAGSDYILRTDVFYGVFFWLMLFIIIMLHRIFLDVPSLKVLIAIGLVIIATDTETKEKTFKDSTYYYAPYVAKKINQDVVNQLIYADENNLDNINLYVPYFNDWDNYPYPDYAGKRISNFVYQYHLTNKYITIKNVVKTNDKNYLLD